MGRYLAPPPPPPLRQLGPTAGAIHHRLESLEERSQLAGGLGPWCLKESGASKSYVLFVKEKEGKPNKTHLLRGGFARL